MPSQQDRIRFLTDPIRLRIAELCLDHPRTRSELATELGRPAGSLSQPQTMVKHGALKGRLRNKASDGRPATAYILDPRWRGALEAARKGRLPNWPEAGQDLLLIPLSDTAEACAAIAQGIPEIEWGAQVRGGVAGLVLAPTRTLDGTGRLRALKALKEIAPQIMALQLDTPMRGAELQSWSARVAAIELPPGR